VSKGFGRCFSPPIDVFSDIFDSSQQRRTCALELHFSPFFDPDQGRMIFVVDRQLNVSRDVYLQIEKKCFQRSFSRFPLFLKPSAPCVGFCRPGKRRCEYSSELVFSFSFSFLSKAERAWPRLLAFSRRCCRAPFSRPGQRVHSDSACFGATAYFSESRECVPA